MDSNREDFLMVVFWHRFISALWAVGPLAIAPYGSLKPSRGPWGQLRWEASHILRHVEHRFGGCRVPLPRSKVLDVYWCFHPHPLVSCFLPATTTCCRNLILLHVAMDPTHHAQSPIKSHGIAGFMLIRPWTWCWCISVLYPEGPMEIWKKVGRRWKLLRLSTLTVKDEKVLWGAWFLGGFIIFCDDLQGASPGHIGEESLHTYSVRQWPESQSSAIPVSPYIFFGTTPIWPDNMCFWSPRSHSSQARWWDVGSPYLQRDSTMPQSCSSFGFALRMPTYHRNIGTDDA